MKLLVLVLALAAFASASVFKVPLKVIESHRSQLMRQGKWEEHFKRKQHQRSKGWHGGEKVLDYDDLEYVGEIRVGTPPSKPFNIVLDTGSANLWIPDDSCEFGSCLNKDRFNSSASSTFKKDGREWQVGYGDGSYASGFLGCDTVTLSGSGGGAGQLTIKNQIFGLATEMYQFDSPIVDGILGLGFTYLADNLIVPPLINAVNQNLIEQQIFTVWMRHRGDKDGVDGGEFTYGDLDNEHCEPVRTWKQLSMASYWQFHLGGLGAGDWMSNRGFEAIADTGASCLVGSRYLVANVARQLNLQLDESTGLYSAPCDGGNLTNIKVSINDQIFEIEPANYIVNLGSECGVCMEGMSMGAFGPSVILGDVFIRQICVVHDIGNQRLGFAPNKKPLS